MTTESMRHIFLGVVSVALIIQIALQGEAMGEKRVLICFFSYILAGLLGILTTLIGTKKD